MNGNSAPQQEQQRVAERVAHLETALTYQGKAITDLTETMRAGFARMDAEFARVNEQLMKIRTTDFRILLGISLTSTLAYLGIMVKMSGWLP